MRKAKTIKEFRSALRAAIEDKRIERQRPVKFYFDAEVVIRAILGFRQLTDSHKNYRDLSEDVMVLRALLSSGYLGRIYMLLPHALELDNYFRSQDDVMPESHQGKFKAEVSLFLKQYQVAEKFSDLLSAVVSSQDSFDRVMEAIKSLDVSSFVAVELANGSMQHRFVNLRRCGVLGFEKRDHELGSAVKSSRIDEYAEAIARHRPEDSRAHRRRTNIYNDAAALTLLWDKIQDSDSEASPEPVVRFYTEAETLIKALREEKKLRDDLSYRDPHKSELVKSVLRPPYYFLLRTYFGALALPHLRAAIDRGEKPISIDELEEFCSELEELPPEEKIEQWTSANVKNERLLEPLNRLESLAFFQGVFLSYRWPEGATAFVDGLHEMSELFREGHFSEEVQERVAREMKGLRVKLSRSTQDLRELFELIEVIEPKVEALHEHWNYPLPTGLRDIGLIRWGFAESSEMEIMLEDRLRVLLLGVPPAWKVACRELADEIRDVRSDYLRAVVVCAILWFIEEFQLVATVITAFERLSASEIPLELHLMKAAALLKSGKLTKDQTERLVGDIEVRVSQVPEEMRIRFNIGLAYVLAHAANVEATLFRARDLDDSTREWLRKSFVLGESVRASGHEWPMLRAFGVNHCAYVGTVVDDQLIVPRDVLDKCMVELDGMRGTPFWNFRFVDTVLMPRYLQAKNTLHTLGDRSLVPDEDVEGEVKEILDLVKEAFDAYTRSAPYFDLEIQAHRRRWEDLEKEAKRIRMLRNQLQANVPAGGHPGW